ncbi:hypothetical protein DERP_004977 [Dermatophagoides pteronyssinus]|uniref:Uncharacterized protein n=1 Tax=Dermatophagoides pteronyssinus TaxID=6956 RepID=A0ABQ8JT48_DERPT|nr:hypothetical protein DERP_004977 [Dermatophagoides pteronyssinus]
MTKLSVPCLRCLSVPVENFHFSSITIRFGVGLSSSSSSRTFCQYDQINNKDLIDGSQTSILFILYPIDNTVRRYIIL